MHRYTASLIAMLFALNALPAAGAEAVLSGQVLYDGNRPAGDVTLSVQGPKATTLTTDRNGRYTLTLPPGDYTIEVNGHTHAVHVYPGNNHRIIRLPAKRP